MWYVNCVCFFLLFCFDFTLCHVTCFSKNKTNKMYIKNVSRSKPHTKKRSGSISVRSRTLNEWLPTKNANEIDKRRARGHSHHSSRMFWVFLCVFILLCVICKPFLPPNLHKIQTSYTRNIGFQFDFITLQWAIYNCDWNKSQINRLPVHWVCGANASAGVRLIAFVWNCKFRHQFDF